MRPVIAEQLGLGDHQMTEVYLQKEEIAVILPQILEQLLIGDNPLNSLATSPTALTANEAKRFMRIPGDNHCAFHCIAQCLLREGIKNPNGKYWTWEELRLLLDTLVAEQIEPSLAIGTTVDLTLARPALVVNECRTAWEVLSRQLKCDTYRSEIAKMLAAIKATDIYSERPDQIVITLSSHISAVMTAYAKAISGNVTGLEKLWAGDLEFTLLARHFKLKIAVYYETATKAKDPPPTDPNESRFLPKHWALLKEYIAHGAKGRLHKLMYENRNHYNYVTARVRV